MTLKKNDLSMIAEAYESISTSNWKDNYNKIDNLIGQFESGEGDASMDYDEFLDRAENVINNWVKENPEFRPDPTFSPMSIKSDIERVFGYEFKFDFDNEKVKVVGHLQQ